MLLTRTSTEMSNMLSILECNAVYCRFRHIGKAEQNFKHAVPSSLQERETHITDRRVTQVNVSKQTKHLTDAYKDVTYSLPNVFVSVSREDESESIISRPKVKDIIQILQISDVMYKTYTHILSIKFDIAPLLAVCKYNVISFIKFILYT